MGDEESAIFRLLSVQQLQQSHSHMTAWWQCHDWHNYVFADVGWTSVRVSILAGTYIALLRPHCVTHCCSVLEDSGKEWHHLAALLACARGLVLSSKHAFMPLDLWGSLVCTVSVGVMDACDITTASLMAWLMCALLLVWIISPVCVNICESTDLCRGLFLFCVCVGADRLQSQRVPIVAIPFILVSLLWLVLCQVVATVIGCSGKGHDPADGSIVSV